MKAQLEPNTEINITCPICGLLQKTRYQITESDNKKTDWLHCYCGTVFNNSLIDKSVFNDNYLHEFENDRHIDERLKYVLKTYLPLVEEMIYGRKFFDVGFCVPSLIKDMKERGWISTGIDIIKNDYITGDFEKFEIEEQFDMIHLGHVIECFESPVLALAKCYELLSRDGVLLLTHPAPELINFVGVSKFGHWNSKANKTFISEKELKRIAIGLGFDIILSRVNHSQRFVSWNDRHMLLQKRY